MEQRIQFSAEQQAAFEALLTTQESVLLSGVAGCGKSTILKHWIDNCDNAKNAVVVAPTGVAALNVGGSTIHRAFGFHPNMKMEDPRISLKVRSLLHRVDTIVIDEISMVRADLLNNMDVVLKSIRRNKAPFGGVRMVMMGDFWQLPPVVRQEEERWMETRHGSRAGWCFFAPCFEELEPQVFFLEHSFRQAGDSSYSNLLNDVRNGEYRTLGVINELGRPPEHQNPAGVPLGDETPRLCARKVDVARYNSQGLQRLGTPSVLLEPVINGDETKIPRDARESVVLAEGARVMITRNGSGYVNGSLGTLIEFDTTTMAWDGDLVPAIDVKLDTGAVVGVPRETLEVIGYEVDPETRKPEKIIIAEITQYPLALGYAWTIHKSQGQSLDRALIDLGRGAFAHGQTYVALSRLRTSAGLFLANPLTRSDLLIDPDVPAFFEGHTTTESIVRGAGPECVKRV